jgi:GNAT superfamily N-acetyltransferase
MILENVIAEIEQGTAMVLIAEFGDRAVGCGLCLIRNNRTYYEQSKYGYVGLMFVRPDFRRRGIARRINDQLREWVITCGVREQRLEVFANNTVAIQTYEDSGYRPLVVNMVCKLNTPQG